MPRAKRFTIHVDERLHQALRRKAVETDRTISDLVNSAVRDALREIASDLGILRERAKEPTLSFEELVRDLKHRGKL